MIFFTSDTHYGHEKILEYCKRPFNNIYEMDETLTANWNAVVHPEDTVYHLGDFAWRNIKQYVERLNGFIHLIRGSHDKQLQNQSVLFTSVSDLLTIKHEGETITLCHYAMRTWYASHFNAWHLYAHSHGKLPGQGKSFDVGVDGNNFTPISFEEVKKRMEKLPDNFNLVASRKGAQA